MQENHFDLIKTEKLSIRQYLFVFFLFLVLLVTLVITAFLYNSNRNRVKDLQAQLRDVSQNDCTAHELQINSYREQLQDLQNKTSEAEVRKNNVVKTVERFLLTYFESEYRDSYTKISWTSNYLSDNAIRQLSPYINSPDEITNEMINKIRNHDKEIITSEMTQFQNTVEKLEIYYEAQNKNTATVFCYFILETGRKGSMTKSPYLLRCNVMAADDGYVIDEITLRSPVILPSYNPETMILE